jgi:hypothetical protein
MTISDEQDTLSYVYKNQIPPSSQVQYKDLRFDH